MSDSNILTSSFEATFKLVSTPKVKTPGIATGYCHCIVALVSCESKDAIRLADNATKNMWGKKSTHFNRLGKKASRSATAPRYSEMGIRFCGELQTWAPYMWHRGTFMIVKDLKYYKCLVLKPVPRSTVMAVRPTTISVRNLHWLLMNEGSKASVAQARCVVADMKKQGIIQARTLDNLIVVAELEAEPYFHATCAHSDLYRMQFQSELIMIFGTETADAARTITEKPPMVLENLHREMRVAPWKLCFYQNCGRRYNGLGELSYAGVCRAMTHFKLAPLADHVSAALRFYDCTIKVRKAFTQDTEFKLQELLDWHVNVKERMADWRMQSSAYTSQRNAIAEHGHEDGRYLDRAVAWLESPDVRALKRFGDGWVGLAEDWFKCKKSIKWMCAMALKQDHPVLRPGVHVPCRGPSDLDEEQALAMTRLIRGDPLVMVSGPPGTGKTAVICAAMARFLNVAVFCSHGTMVRELQRLFAGGGSKFREDTAFTIDHVATLTQFSKQSTKDWLMRYDIVIVDEASNMDQDHIFKLLKSMRAPGDERDARGFKQLLLVFDHNQQRPVGPGEPVLALTTMFPQALVTLVHQHRVHPSAVAIADAAIVMLDPAKGPSAIQFASVTPKNTSSRNPGHMIEAISVALRDNALVHIDSQLCSRYSPTSSRDICQQFILEPLLNKMGYAAGGISNWREWQFIAFRKADVDRISLGIFYYLKAHIMREETWVKVHNSNTRGYMKDGLLLCKGTKIVFTKTFKGAWDSLAQKRSHPEVRNNQIAVVHSIDSDGRHCTLEDGRVILFDSGFHVDPRYVKYAYCVTANSSQGMGCRAVCVVPHAKTRNLTWPCRDSVYTAMTRAKRLCVMYGKREDFDEYASRIPRVRNTMFKRLLAQSTMAAAIEPGRERPFRLNPPAIRNVDTLIVVPHEDQVVPGIRDDPREGFTWKYGDVPDTMDEGEEGDDAYLPNPYIWDHAMELPMLSARTKRTRNAMQADEQLRLEEEEEEEEEEDDDGEQYLDDAYPAGFSEEDEDAYTGAAPMELEFD